MKSFDKKAYILTLLVITLFFFTVLTLSTPSWMPSKDFESPSDLRLSYSTCSKVYSTLHAKSVRSTGRFTTHFTLVLKTVSCLSILALRTTRRTPTRDTNSTTLSNSEEPSKPKKKKRIISFIYTAFMLALPFCLYSFYAFCTSSVKICPSQPTVVSHFDESDIHGTEVQGDIQWYNAAAKHEAVAFCNINRCRLYIS